jgi:hypothetical protein
MRGCRSGRFGNRAQKGRIHSIVCSRSRNHDTLIHVSTAST